MEEILQNDDLKLRYSETLNLIQDLQDYQRIPAENRFLLIKEYEEYFKKESERLGKGLRRIQAIKDFCDINGINWKTFYRHKQMEQKGGIAALVPNYGNQKGKRKYVTVLPIIKEIVEPNKGFKRNFNAIVPACVEKGLKIPSYATFRRITLSLGLLKTIKKKKEESKSLRDLNKIEVEEPIKCIPKRYKVDTPKWLKITVLLQFS